MLSLKTESDVLHDVANSLRTHRLALGWRQEDLAEKSGVAIATLRRFEQSGQIGFLGLARLLVSLGRADDFLAALKPSPANPRSIAAFMSEGRREHVRQRARLEPKSN